MPGKIVKIEKMSGKFVKFEKNDRKRQLKF